MSFTAALHIAAIAAILVLARVGFLLIWPAMRDCTWCRGTGSIWVFRCRRCRGDGKHFRLGVHHVVKAKRAVIDAITELLWGESE